MSKYKYNATNKLKKGQICELGKYEVTIIVKYNIDTKNKSRLKFLYVNTHPHFRYNTKQRSILQT